MNILISIYLECMPSKDLLKKLSVHSSFSATALHTAIKNKNPVLETSIDNEKFYTGIFKIIEFIDLLDNLEIVYELTKDGNKVERCYLDDIACRLKKITLEDFR